MDVRRLLDQILGRWDDRCRVRDGAHDLVLAGEPEVAVHVLVDGGRASLHDGVHEAPIARVSIPAALLSRMIAEGETFDPGMLDAEAQRAIRYAGDTSFLAELMNLVRRPPAEVARRLRAAELRAAARPRPRSVERLDRPSPRAVRDALAESVPVVLTGALPWWSADRWSFERVAADWGHLSLPLVGPRRTLGEFLASMRDVRPGAEHYTRGCLVPAELARAVAPPVFPPEAFVAQLWLGVSGDGGAVTNLHRDATDALLVQLAGDKRVLFYSPDQAELVYPYRNFNAYQKCWVEPWAPDLARFPRFAEAEGLEVVLRPGEVLLNPIGWFHCVFADEPTMSVSFCARLGAALA